MGDGATVFVVTLILCFVKYRWAILIAMSGLISSLITKTLKHTLFSNEIRPKKFFEGMSELKLIPWVENHSYNSFPSGHAMNNLVFYATLTYLVWYFTISKI